MSRHGTQELDRLDPNAQNNVRNSEDRFSMHINDLDQHLNANTAQKIEER